MKDPYKTRNGLVYGSKSSRKLQKPLVNTNTFGSAGFLLTPIMLVVKESFSI
jgi:hypothetical protein